MTQTKKAYLKVLPYLKNKAMPKPKSKSKSKSKSPPKNGAANGRANGQANGRANGRSNGQGAFNNHNMPSVNQQPTLSRGSRYMP